jgi:hypothetical protein
MEGIGKKRTEEKNGKGTESLGSFAAIITTGLALLIIRGC